MLAHQTGSGVCKPLLPKRSGIEGNCAVLQNVALIEEEGEGKEEGRGGADSGGFCCRFCFCFSPWP